SFFTGRGDFSVEIPVDSVDLGVKRRMLFLGFFADAIDFGVQFGDVASELAFQVARGRSYVADQRGADAEQSAQRYPGVQIHDAHSSSVPAVLDECQQARHTPGRGNTPIFWRVDNIRPGAACG